MPLLPIYKKKQGQVVRWTAFLTFVALWLFATYRCFGSFPEWEWTSTVYMEGIVIPLIDYSLPVVTPKLLVSLGIGLLLIIMSAYFCFLSQRTSDFLIDTESEMRKVSWPTMKEVVKSSTVVIIAIIILALYLFVVDIGFDSIFQRVF
ncbi:preprotein translocase subunit SecE [Candidatus Uabimicrobium amorphum]|uniref:Protein translocase subunit SecE n=1 Tax=Uabimicrobium amorphum TaxID=2596890 RepID=A0A5S9F4I0_UABAM|nr:preprotein translocase subunit SecE [Candidatus Uabimicrobium amorphum]BBM85568.1 protein translocase subunit SecE [Candidatus Uabimicrobium amorphum]